MRRRRGGEVVCWGGWAGAFRSVGNIDPHARPWPPSPRTAPDLMGGSRRRLGRWRFGLCAWYGSVDRCLGLYPARVPDSADLPVSVNWTGAGCHEPRALRLAALALAASCVFLGGDTAGLGEECLFNGDCRSPLVCARAAGCRAPCRDDRDCVSGWRCRGERRRAPRLPPRPTTRGYCRLAADCRPPCAAPTGRAQAVPRGYRRLWRYCSPSAPSAASPLDLPGGERASTSARTTPPPATAAS